jgi:hypothetical protein
VVQEPVEDPGGDDRIAEHGRELGGGFLGGAPAVTEPRRFSRCRSSDRARGADGTWQ